MRKRLPPNRYVRGKRSLSPLFRWYWLLIGIITVTIGLTIFMKLSTNPNETSTLSLKDARLYVNPESNAAIQAELWRNTRPNDAATMDKLAAQPIAKWITSPDAVSQELPPYLKDAADKDAIPVLVSYFIPFRDCGRYSAGGAASGNEYRTFIDQFADTIGKQETIVIIEPDALPGIEATGDGGKPCLTNEQRNLQYSLIKYAVSAFTALPGTKVYIDAGNSAWIPDANEMARRLRKANVAAADGFSLNISNFRPTLETIAYGQDVSAKLHNTHFVIDTSRNGLGAYENPKEPAYNWCNPPGRALGQAPTTNTHHKLVDAYLYIKAPGESDGYDPDTNKCFGGPQAGVWWPEYALGLIERWPADLQKQ